jgi:phosphomannomutase
MSDTDYIKIYTDFLESHISLKKPIKIVCDCSNGTEGRTLEYLKKSNIPNLEIIPINDTPDPDFPAHGPNPLIAGATDQATKKVLETGADFGVIFDADADRAFFVDDKGETLPSFMIAILLFKNHTPPLVADEWVYQSLRHMNIFSEKDLIPSRIGTRYVKEVLKDARGSVAAEFSGHYYFKDFFNSDSGIFTMIKVANIVSGLKMKLSEFIQTLPEQYIKNDDIKLGQKKWSDIEPGIQQLAKSKNAKIETREGMTIDMGDTWVNLRTSNTEPLVRIIAGGTDQRAISELIEQIRGFV